MKVLLSWLREFAPFDASPEDLGDTLSDLGLAVEEMEYLGRGLDGIVVARVLETRKHPNADRIQIVDVDLGDGEALQICCGAFNMAAGDLVPLATIGTTMADGRGIQRSKMRGEWSNGMLCSARELGLPEDHGGILILPPDLAVGANFRDAYCITEDVLYDLDLTPNRPDGLSVAGIARDLAARYGLAFTLCDPQPAIDASATAATESATVTIEAPDLCGRFAARILRRITVAPSPDWLVRRLAALGVRTINNVVDVSNYVMLELGTPSHTFDLDKIAGSALRVRWARDGEQLVTLDGQTRTLVARDGVIADANDVVVSLAGVMGGLSTEISATTTDVLVELAWWDPMTIARTSRRLGLRSEAATRFERGTDPAMIDVAMRRFVELLARTGPVSLAPGQIDERGGLAPPAVVSVRSQRVNAMLGTDLTPAAMKALIEPIGFACGDGEESFSVAVPSWRPDTTIEIDVAEEIARQYGFSRIVKTVPTSPRAGSLSQDQQDRRALRRALVGFGLTEAMPVPFLASGDLADAGLCADAITVTNPLVAEESVLRTSLRPGLLKSIAYNESHRLSGADLFELGHVYLPTDRNAELPDERELLGVARAGQDAPAAVEALQVVVDALALTDVTLGAAEPAGLHPTRSAIVSVGGVAVGHVGEIDPQVAEVYGVAERVAWLELDLTTIFGLPHGQRRYRQVSRFPSSDLDLAFVVADAIAVDAVANTLRQAGGDLVVDLALFDVYRGSQVPAGHRSVAYRLRLQAKDRTLTDDDLATTRVAMVAAVLADHQAALRTI